MNTTSLNASRERLRPSGHRHRDTTPFRARKATPRHLLLAVFLVALPAWPTRLGATDLQATNVAQSATPQARFDLAYQSMTTTTREYVNDALKTIAFLLLAVGWLVSSNRSRKFLKDSPLARWAGLVVVPTVAILHVWLALTTYQLSQSKATLLEGLNYMPAQYFAGDEIRLKIFIANLVIHVALFATLITLIVAARFERESPGEQTA